MRMYTKILIAVLLADNMRIKLADFGAALVKPKGTSARWGIAGVSLLSALMSHVLILLL